MKRHLCILLSVIFCCLAFTGCGGQMFSSYKRDKIESNELQFQTPSADAPVAVFQTNLGTIKAVLYPDVAPIAVENFIYLAQSGYYDGLEFYRVMQGFVVQSGSPNNNGTGGTTKWGKPFANEFSDLLHHYTGALAMANRDTADEQATNTSIFYFVQSAQNSVTGKIAEQMKTEGWREDVISAYKKAGGTPYLDNCNTVFGQVYFGLDIVDSIAMQDVDENDKPTNPVILQKVSISTYGDETAIEQALPTDKPIE